MEHGPLPNFAARRASLFNALSTLPGVAAEDSAIILFSPPVAMRNSDVDFPFRPDSDLYWLTGFSEPDVTVVLLPGHPESESVVFLRPKDPVREIWDGRRLGVEAAPEALGFSRAFDHAELESTLPKLLYDRPHIFTLLDREPTDAALVLRTLTRVRANSRRRGRHPFALYDLGAALHPLRLLKDDADIASLSRAVEVSAAGHLRAMRRAKPRMNERQLEAELSYAFMKAGAPRHGYSPIVAGGENACILHYVENDADIDDGALVLIDAGAEVDMMSGDITRTWPVSGTFRPAQRAVYDVVLAANLAAIDRARPGTPFAELDTVARRVLAEGLVDLGFLSGDVDGLIEKVRAPSDPPWTAGKAPLDRFYPHSTGHWLGMDVHDVGPYHDGATSTPLAPRMAFTIEPGLYLDGQDIPEEFRGIGIRIEDDLVVTSDGPKVLSAGAPKTPEAMAREIGADAEKS